MKRASLPVIVVLGLGALTLVPLPLCADQVKHLSPDRIDVLDQRGVFKPEFKSAIHALVDALQQTRDAEAEQKKIELELPALNDQVQQAEAKAAALRRELAKYEHTDEGDFAALQARMSDATAKPEEQLALAQAYIWTYPASPHAGHAQQYLQQVQKKIADALQAAKDAQAARAAAQAKLVEGAEARNLSLSDWRDFLRDMSQADLLKYIGQPNSRQGDDWIYSGEWVIDPALNHKAGMDVNFNGGRVFRVDELPSAK